MRKNLCFILNELINNVNELIRLGKGDLGRLEHIKETIENSKKLYNSDLNYINDLVKEHLSSENELTVTNEKNIQVPTTNSTGNSFCDNCGSALAHDSVFCNKCRENVQKSTQSKKSASNYSHSIPDSITIKIPRFDMALAGVVLIIVSVIVVNVIPINNLGFSMASIKALCDSPLGAIGKAFSEDAVTTCSEINGIIDIFWILGFIGLILILVGISTKKNMTITTDKPHSRYLTPEDDISYKREDENFKDL
jgi:hypothetical protein